MAMLMISAFVSLKLVSGLECNWDFCPKHWINDGYCDSSCSILPCSLDIASNELLEPLSSTFEASDCYLDCIFVCERRLLSNSVCDVACDTAVCGYDLGECGYCASGCKDYLGYQEMLGDGVCHEECNTPECKADDGDCVKSRVGMRSRMLEGST
jgi:hypothetical protein